MGTVTIGTVSGASLTKINNVDADGNTTLSGADAPNALGNRSYTLTYEVNSAATTAGKQDIAITTTTDTTGETFTVYVVPDSDITATVAAPTTGKPGIHSSNESYTD